MEGAFSCDSHVRLDDGDLMICMYARIHVGMHGRMKEQQGDGVRLDYGEPRERPSMKVPDVTLQVTSGKPWRLRNRRMTL